MLVDKSALKGTGSLLEESKNNLSTLIREVNNDIFITKITNNTSNKVGDSALQVYTSDQKHPAIRTTAPNANGYTMFSDAYKSDESQVNIGVSYSSAKLVLSTSVKPSDTADNTYLSSQDTFSARPCALTMNHQGVLQFLNTTTNATTTTDDHNNDVNEPFLHINCCGHEKV